ncbi:MAG: glycosyltransferase family 39 protein [Flavobacteriaceae bacterium]|nr:glycosyltransferase family 39 protein [Flavobacteriaceae bacterium]
MKQNKKHLFFLFLASVVIFTSHLDITFVDIMESRNFITAREMLQNGNWIHTTMNLEPRYEKPPLPTWMTAASASVFGLDSIAGLRLPAALMAIFLVFTSYFFGKKLLKDQNQAFYGALILATSFYIVFAGRNGQWDIFAHSFMFFSIYQYFLAFESEKIVWKHWILAGFFSGLTIMSKGPIPHYALLLPFLIAYGFVFRYKGFRNKWKALFVSILVMAIVGLSWALYIYITDGPTAFATAEKETGSWSKHNVRPFYYYWNFFIQSGLWTFFAFMAILYPYMIRRVQNEKIYKFYFLWTVFAVIVLSFVPIKKARYLMPVLIPLAFTTSFYIEFLVTKAKKLSRTDTWLASFGFGLIGIIGLAFPLGAWFYFADKLEGFYLWYALTSIALFTTAVFLFRFLAGKKFEKAFYALVIFLSAVILFGYPMANILYDNPDHKDIGEVRNVPLAKDLPLYHLGYFAPEFMWRIGEPVKEIEKPEEIRDLERIGIFVNDSVAAIIRKQYPVEFETTYDANVVKPGKKNYKDRRAINFLIVSNNSADN